MNNPNDIRSFSAQIDRMVVDLDDRTDRIWRGTCSTVSENIKVGGKYGPGTPRDTSFAANSWTEGINGEGEFRQPAAPPHGKATVVAIAATVFDYARLKLGQVFFFVSNCVYMRSLDYGHSQQAPNGHVRLVTAALPQIVAEQVAEARR